MKTFPKPPKAPYTRRIKNLKIPLFRAGDEIYVTICFNNQKRKHTLKAIVKGFSAIGIHYEANPLFNSHHFCQGLFYGFGYHKDGYVIHTKKKWHIRFAFLFEKIRLLMSEKWAIWFRLQAER